MNYPITFNGKTYIVDLETYNLLSGRLFVQGEINEKSIHEIELALYTLDKNKTEIELVIDSVGGDVDEGLKLYDLLSQYKIKSVTVSGKAISMAGIIFVCSPKGTRYMHKNSKIMLHQPFMMLQGKMTDVRGAYKQNNQQEEKIYKMLSKSTGKTVKQIADLLERDTWFNAEEALRCGLTDAII